MKNITILMTVICAMIGPFALTQSILKLTPDQAEKIKVDKIYLTLKTATAAEQLDGMSLEVTNGNGQTTLVSTADPNSGLTYHANHEEFELSTTNHGGYLRITPKMNLDPLNGVNTYDLILISLHILAQQPLSSPYRIIAADVSNSGTVTTFDMVELRKLILGTYDELPNVSSWRFIDKNQVFSNPLNPFNDPLLESVEPLSTPPPYRADFIAIKTGDVDETATPNNFIQTEDRALSTYHFNVQDRMVKAGEEFTVQLEGECAVGGYQFTLNAKDLNVLAVIPGVRLTADHFALFSGERSSGWAPVLTAAVENGATDFSVRFKALNDGLLSDMLQMGNQITPALAFEKNGTAYTVGLTFKPAAHTESVLQIAPNPWNRETTIGFTLPSDQQTTFRVYDLSGKVVYSKSMYCNKGFHQLSLSEAEITGFGTFLYEIEAGDYKETGRMVKM